MNFIEICIYVHNNDDMVDFSNVDDINNINTSIALTNSKNDFTITIKFHDNLIYETNQTNDIDQIPDKTNQIADETNQIDDEIITIDDAIQSIVPTNEIYRIPDETVIYAHSFNILRIMAGMSGLSYSS
ncbi:divergent capsid protein [Fadolivirus algeromassiliense]|jgi:hypothetical protein|uniref:Divergent capsid protein n=1 Tax=Fadolivirus FV1/VV64 TaxID=3070911 RepID=A0A7D3R0V7_9VIRU|nr:divergent capsid protein [Fadolivirus algeromassiliense]QKF94022.1 divergent capsid protein [Fadolivirus FV1/VV64]